MIIFVLVLNLSLLCYFLICFLEIIRGSKDEIGRRDEKEIGIVRGILKVRIIMKVVWDIEIEWRIKVN